VNADGTIKQQLRFIPARFVSAGVTEREVSILSDSNSKCKAIPASNAGGLFIVEPYVMDRITSWKKSSDNRIAILHTDTLTYLVSLSENRTIKEFPYKTWDVSFASHASVVAMAVKRELRGVPWRVVERKIIAVDYDGNVVLDTGFERCHYNQLYLSPNGDAVTFIRQEDRGSQGPGPEVTATIRTQDGYIKTHDDVPFGTRHYSGDGHFAIVIQGGYGKVFYFDVSDPFNPVRLGDYDAGEVIGLAALSDDGRLIAIDRLRRDDRTQKEVVILDGNLKEIAITRPSTGDEFWGLQFAGTYLFVGMQKDPLPAYQMWKQTRCIDLFDLTQLDRKKSE
jgi:hypothetical protein